MTPKFRSWDKYNKVMAKVISIDFESKVAYVECKDGDRYDIHFDNLVIMQSTGLLNCETPDSEKVEGWEEETNE